MPRGLSRAVRGTSLVELLVGMLLGLIVLGIALQLLLITRARYQRIADEALIEDRGTQALELLTMAIHQAGWIADTPASWPVRRWLGVDAPPSLMGEDNCNPELVDGIQCRRAPSIGGSDALLVRFAGRSSQADGLLADDSITDCSGYGVPERIEGGGDDPRAGVMLFYVIGTTSGEPGLMCAYRKRQDRKRQPEFTRPHPSVLGVETLQLLYEIAATPDAPAATVSARALDPTHWHRVRAVHVALVVRGDRLDPNAASRPAPTLVLFPNLPPNADTTVQDTQFSPTTEIQRRRAVFTATIRLRNPLACEVDAC